MPYLQYVIPAALTFLFGLLLWQIQRDRTSLDYEVVESAPFPIEANNDGRYFVVRIRNSGNKQIDNIELKISMESGSIHSTSFSDAALVTDFKTSESALHGKIPLLNPMEVLGVTLTTLGPRVSSPTIVARAPGVTASLRSESVSSGQILTWLVPLVALIALLGTLFGYFSAYRSNIMTATVNDLERTQKSFSDTIAQESKELDARRQEMEKLRQSNEQRAEEWKQQEKAYSEGKPEVHQAIFSVFSRAGIGDRFFDLVGSATEVTYWKTALFLVQCFLIDERRRDNYVAAAQALVDTDNKMSPSSLGFILYLLAKMEQFRGNNERAKRWFDMCKLKAPLMYDHLMAQDATYDLKIIRQHISPGKLK